MPKVYVISAIAFLAFIIYAFIDCLLMDRFRIRALPRAVWALIIAFIPLIGALLWFTIGRAKLHPHGAAAAGASVAPDDNPVFLRQLGADKQRDARIRELEERLAELDDDQNNSKDK